MRSKNEKKKGGWIIPVLLLLVIAAAAAVLLLRPEDNGPGPKPVVTGPAVGPATTMPDETLPQETRPIVDTVQQINLGYGLTILDSGKYTGLYMEDGSNEVVSDVMMIIVQNDGEQDVQLADIVADAGGETFHFRLTDLAVGSRAVLLELERKPAGADVTSAVLENTVLYDEPMEMQEDVIRISGLEGMVNVQNISDEDIDGDIYVYYKYAAEDLYYGGITFRVRVEGGLKAGEIRQVPAGHYQSEGCEIVRVTIYG